MLDTFVLIFRNDLLKCQQASASKLLSSHGKTAITHFWKENILVISGSCRCLPEGHEENRSSVSIYELSL